MEGEAECFSLEELALEAFLDSFDCDALQQFPSGNCARITWLFPRS
jgi:hypothetical protein